MTRALDKLTAVRDRLAAIRIVNGYTTEAGQSVHLGPVPRLNGEPFPYLRLHETGAAPESVVPNRPVNKLSISFVVEAYEQQDNPTLIVADFHALIGDLKKSLFGDAMRDLGGEAIAATLEGYSLVAPEEGSTTFIAQMRGSFTFTDKFDAP